MHLGECAGDFRHLVRDPDAKYTATFDAVLASVGIQTLLGGQSRIEVDPVTIVLL